MSTDYRALCAELVDDLEMSDWPYKLKEVFRADITRARAALAQPEPVAPTDEDLQNIFWWECDWQKKMDEEAFKVAARAVLAHWGTPPPQPVWADIHYAWELEDAEGEWQAGGSANSLEDVQREGNRYLQTYSQDGPHKLIIQRHCVNTIEEVTND